MAKPKFDVDKLKQFGIEHGEKFGVAAAVLILGLFIVKAVSHESLPESMTADGIRRTNSQAHEHVDGDSNKTVPTEQDVKPVNFDEEIRSTPTKLATMIKIPPIEEEPFPDPVKRVDPSLYAVEELRATAFRGGIVLSAGAGLGAAQMQQPLPAAAAAPAPVAATAAPTPAAGGLAGNRTSRFGSRTRPGIGLRPTPAPAPVAKAPAIVPVEGATAYPAGLPGPTGTGAADGAFGIVVTGLIPVGKQREEYSFRFKNALHSTGDTTNLPPGVVSAQSQGDLNPAYEWCFLVRADMTTGQKVAMNFGDRAMGDDQQNADASQREAISNAWRSLGVTINLVTELEGQRHKWTGVEVVPRDYLLNNFTLSLPPVLLRNWGPEAAHIPQVPLLGMNTSAGHLSAKPGMPGASAPSNNTFGEFSRPNSPVTTSTAAQPATAEEINYKLFRFVDFDVDPGHVYRYSVRLLVRNPNWGKEPQVLANPASRMVPYLVTAWSEPSAAAVVPPSLECLAVGIDRPKHGGEQKANIDVLSFDPAQAVELVKLFDSDLGALIGTTKQDQTVKNVADPVRHQVHEMTGNFRTPSVLLDFRGNEPLPGQSSVSDPAEMLLLDNVDSPDGGRLVVINEAKDKAEIDDWNATHLPSGETSAAAGASKTSSKAEGAFAPGGLHTAPSGLRPAGR